jgi:hypothetical protein
VEIVETRAGRPGTIVAWAGSCALGAVRVSLGVRGFALRDGQAAWEPNPGLAGEAAYAALAGRGATLSAGVRVAAGPHARAGATWTARGAGPGRTVAFLSLDL